MHSSDFLQADPVSVSAALIALQNVFYFVRCVCIKGNHCLIFSQINSCN